MNDNKITKEQLVKELNTLRVRVAELDLFDNESRYIKELFERREKQFTE
jgi:hypothetical protein